MRDLSELPHRFWPSAQIPQGIAVWPKPMNLKSAEFIKLYTRAVNPRLKALGFNCKSARARLVTGDRVAITSFAGDKSGGAGYIAFGAHIVGLPARNHFAVAPGAIDFPHCVFLNQLRLFAGPHGTRFDLGKDETEAEETIALMLALIEEQAIPFLAGLPDALAALDSLEPGEFDARMPALVERHHIRVTDSALGRYPELRVDLALLLARRAHLKQRREAAVAWARLGHDLLAAGDWPPHPRHQYAIMFDKLIAGAPELEFTAADRAEHDRRMAQQ